MFLRARSKAEGPAVVLFVGDVGQPQVQPKLHPVGEQGPRHLPLHPVEESGPAVGGEEEPKQHVLRILR